MKFVKLLVLMVIVLQISVGHADSQDDLAKQAETAYSSGDFKVAAGLYQQLVDQGVIISDVYFDLGNSYFQLHDLGRALLNYRRAELLTPRDEDLRFNLARIRAQRVDGKIAEVGILGQIARMTDDWLSVTELSWIVIIMWWLCCGLVAAYLWRIGWRKWARWAIVTSALLFVIMSILTVARIAIDGSRKPAIVINDSVAVMTGPGTNYVEIFELHAAAEVRIVESRNNWVRFQLPDLREGWVDALSLEII